VKGTRESVAADLVEREGCITERRRPPAQVLRAAQSPPVYNTYSRRWLEAVLVNALRASFAFAVLMDP